MRNTSPHEIGTFTDLSSGFHDPEGFNRTVSVVTWELRKTNAAAQGALKKTPVKQ